MAANIGIVDPDLKKGTKVLEIYVYDYILETSRMQKVTKEMLNRKRTELFNTIKEKKLKYPN